MNLKAFLSRPGDAFGLLTVFYICYMFLPRMVPQGMFVDGLLYSSISRNLAEGRGSWWLPFFSHSYWIADISHDHYYENPPLLFWMQSVFFRVFGDHWWVEKLYSTILLGLNCYLIIRIWKTVLKIASCEITMLWLPVLFFYLIPIVFWGSSYNLMDSQLLTFCLLGVWMYLLGVIPSYRRYSYYALGSLFVFLGMLTKGPLAIYPVALPFLYFLVFDRTRWRTGILHSFLLFTSVILMFIVLLWVCLPAQYFFSQYWEQRLGAAIMGGRDESVRHGAGRLYVGWILLRENSILIGLTAIIFIITLLKRKSITPLQQEQKWAIVFLLLALSGSAPLILSTRQAAMYLIPSLVMFAIAAALFHYPLIRQWISSISVRVNQLIAVVMILGILGVTLFSILEFGIPGRDIAFIEDIGLMQAILPRASTVAVCDELMVKSATHVYLQRYLEVELTSHFEEVNYAILDRVCESVNDSILQGEGFVMIFKGKKLSLYSH